MSVTVKTCHEFDETFKRYERDERIKKAIKDFIDFKKNSPSQKYGAKDYKFPAGELVDYWHSGLTFDVSVLYQIERKGDDYTFKLYGVYSHDESGTGQPSNIKKQKSLRKRLDHQVF